MRKIGPPGSSTCALRMRAPRVSDSKGESHAAHSASSESAMAPASLVGAARGPAARPGGDTGSGFM